MDEFSPWSMIGALVLFLVGILCLGAAFFRQSDMDAMTNFVLAIGGLISFGTASLITISHFGPQLVYIYRQVRFAHAETEPRIMLIKALEGMDRDTMRLASHYVGVLTAIGGTSGPIVQWKTGEDSSVPYEWFRDFVLATTKDKGRYWLPAIRTWAEGSLDRGYAEDLTAHFIQVGLARPAIGRFSSEWIDFDLALRWCGLVEQWSGG